MADGHPSEQSQLEAEDGHRVGSSSLPQSSEFAAASARWDDREVLEDDSQAPSEREVPDVLGYQRVCRTDGQGAEEPDDPFAADVTESAAGSSV